VPSTAHTPPAVEFYFADDHCADENIGHLLRRVATSIRRQADKRLQGHGLTSAQWKVLSRIQRGDCTTIASLAREAATDAGAMTRLLDRLEAKGLCKRVRSCDDRRTINVELTRTGAAAASRVAATLAEVSDAHLSGFPDEAYRELMGYLQRMLGNGLALRDGTRARAGFAPPEGAFDESRETPDPCCRTDEGARRTHG